jgi:hypothetical protein
MLAISYPGNSLLLPALVLLTVVFFWLEGLRLEALLVGGLSTISLLLNLLDIEFEAACREVRQHTESALEIFYPWRMTHCYNLRVSSHHQGRQS